MARVIVKLEKDGHEARYLDWSTVVDAPLTYGATREEFKAYYEEEYGANSMSDFEERMKRTDDHGCSSYISTRSGLFECYEGVRTITVEEMWELFVDGRKEEQDE